MKIITFKDFKTKKGYDTSHIVVLSNNQIIHCYDHSDESIKEKCENYYKGVYNLQYKIYKNIFK